MDRQRDAARQLQPAEQRALRLHARHVLRPAERHHHQRHADRRPDGRPDRRRARLERRLEPDLERAHRAVRRRLDTRSGDPIQVAPLSTGPRPGLGHPAAPQSPVEERGRLSDTAGPRARTLSHLPRVAGRHPRRCRGPVHRPAVRSEAVSHRRPQLERRPVGPDDPRVRERRVGRRQVRGDREPDAGFHAQHRLRPGRGGRAAGEPDPIQPVLPGETRVFPREPGNVRFRRRRRSVRWLRRNADHVLQPADRVNRRTRGPDRGRGTADGAGRTVHPRAGQHPDRRGADRRRTRHQLHRGAAEAGCAAPEQHRSHRHEPLGARRGTRLEPGGGR